MTGIVFDIKGFALHDGPGIRTTVFLKGCPLRCMWCHNPEGLSPLPQLCVKETACVRCGKCFLPCGHPECQPFGRCLHICPNGCISVAGETYTAKALLERLLRDKDVFTHAGGGVTFSGGEPLLQWQFVCETAKLLRQEGIHTAMETCGYAEPSHFRETVAEIDYVLFDLKLAEEAAHLRYTGVSNQKILANFAYLRHSGKPYLVRTPLIPSITDTEENLSAIRQYIGDSPWEKLPYNGLAGAKYANFGMYYPLDTEN